MNRRDGEALKGFHELPLVLFTAVATAGAGIGAASLGLDLVRWVPMGPSPAVRIWVLLLLGFGLVVSTGHLGRPLRSPRALARVGRSPLSNEVVLIGTAVTFCIGAVLLPPGHAALAWTWMATCIFCVLVLLALGRVYRLPGQMTWEGSAVFHPAVLGLGFGFTAMAGSVDPGVEARIDLLILGLLAADALFVWAGARRISQGLKRGLPTWPAAMELRTPMLVGRMALGVLFPAVAIVLGARPVAVVALAMNLLLDRFLFYGLGVRHSTEAEIHRIEDVLAGMGTVGGSGGDPGPEGGR